MRKRFAGFATLGFAAILAANQQAAWGSDTIWDLLRKGDPASPRSAPMTVAEGLPAPNAAVRAILSPAVGPIPALAQIAAPPGTIWDLLRTGAPAVARTAPMTIADGPPPGNPAGLFAGAPTNPQYGVNPALSRGTPFTMGGTVQAMAPAPAAPPGTMWDLLRKGDPVVPRATAMTVVETAANPVMSMPPMETGGRHAHADTDTIWDMLRHGDPASERSTPMTVADVNKDPHAGMHLARDPRTGETVWVADARVRRHESGVLGFFDNVGGDLQDLGKKYNSDIELHGDKTIGYHLEHVTGDATTYQDNNYFGAPGVGGTYNNTDLLIQGKLFGVVNFTQHLSDSLYGNPNSNLISLDYQNKKYKFDAGDIQAGIAGNSLVNFSRALWGVEFSDQITHSFRMTTLFSQTRAVTRTVTLQGNGRNDGYYVYAGQIVDGSAQVRVNNQPMTQGTDYTLDSNTGELTFKPGMILNPTDVIAVSFEVYGDGTQPGTISGFRGDLDVSKTAKVGFTMLSQNTPNSGTQASQQHEQQPGANLNIYSLLQPVAIKVTTVNGAPYATPIYPMTVTVNGLPLVYGTDYVVNPLLPNQVIFKESEPGTVTVYFTYTPALNTEATGNRNILGVDSTFALGKLGNITAEYASSALQVGGQNVTGAASNIRGDMRLLHDNLSWTWSLHSIGDNFTAIESPGFNQNQSGFTTGLNYNASKNLKLNFSYDSDKRPDYGNGLTGISSPTTGIAAPTGSDNYTQSSLTATYKLGKAGNLNFNHNVMDTKFGAGGDSYYATDGVDASYKLKSLSVDLSVSRNIANSLYPTTTSTTTTTTTSTGTSSSGTGSTGSTSSSSSSSTQFTNTNTSALSQRLTLNWVASKVATFDFVVSNNALSGFSSTGTSTSRDIQVNANITPAKNMKLSLGYQIADSGGTSGLATTGTTGVTTQAAIRGAVLANMFRDDTGSTGGSNPFNPNYGSYGGSTTAIGTTYYGGGVNAGLGSYGNYSGGLAGSGLTNYGTGSFGGDSNALTVGWSWNPSQATNLSVNYSKSYSNGDYLLNSASDTIAFVIGFNPSQRFGFTSNFNLQRMNYVGSAGGSNSSTAGVTLHTQPFGKLTVDLNGMVMRSGAQQTTTTTSTTGGTTTTTTTTGSTGIDPITGLPGGLTGGYIPNFGAFNTNMLSYGFKLGYPLWRGQSLYFTLDDTNTSGTGAVDLRTLTFGISFDLGNHKSFNIGWRDESSVDHDSSSTGGNLSYHVSSLDANFGLHF